MPEYHAVRAKTGFLELCKTPSLAAEVTVTAAERLGGYKEEISGYGEGPPILSVIGGEGLLVTSKPATERRPGRVVFTLSLAPLFR